MDKGKKHNSSSRPGSRTRAGRNGDKSSKRGGRASASPKRKDMISLGEEKLPVRRGRGKVEKVPADVLMLEGMIQRALGKQSFNDVAELYRRLDAEEALMSTTRKERSLAGQPKARQVAKLRTALTNMVRLLSSRQDELIELEVAEFEYGVLVMNLELKLRLRSVL